MDAEERKKLAAIGRGELVPPPKEEPPEQKKSPVSTKPVSTRSSRAAQRAAARRKKQQIRLIKMLTGAAIVLIAILVLRNRLVLKDPSTPPSTAEVPVTQRTKEQEETKTQEPEITQQEMETTQSPVETTAVQQTSLASDTAVIDPHSFTMPLWITEDFVRVNEYSRPQIPMQEVQYIGIHWVANAGTSAQGNRNYFDHLGDPEDPVVKRHASAHFVIGLEGEILQVMPLWEMAYGIDDTLNPYTINIECCHPTDEGYFNEKTTESLLKLCAWLMQHYNLERDDIIRHYDGTGKDCPKYYVDHPTAWEALKDQIDAYCKANPDIE